MKYKILLLGSGFTSLSVIEYFNKRGEYILTTASNDNNELNRLTNIYKHIKTTNLDLNNITDLESLVEKNDIVISLLPYIFHVKIANICLEKNKNMVTASYISDGLKSLDEKAKDKKVLILNEVGLDPGIDHMATMEVKHREEDENKGKILEYYSFCGGLVNPEDNDNYLGYKFSWSPIGVLRALNNNAVFLKNNKIEKISNKDLLYSSSKFYVNSSLNLFSYPNRDSTKYKDIYGFKDINTLIRGTLRFGGFCEIIAAFKSLNLLVEEKFDQKYNNFIEYLTQYLKNIKISKNHISKLNLKDLVKIDIDNTLLNKLITVILSHNSFLNFNSKELTDRINIILLGLDELNFFNEKGKILDHNNKMNSLSELLKIKISMDSKDKDYIVMVHYFKIRDKNGQIKYIKSQMIKSGKENGLSAMSATVGYPVAIATKNILLGEINEIGVQGPFKKSIYTPIVKELREMNLFCNEKEIKIMPKL